MLVLYAATAATIEAAVALVSGRPDIAESDVFGEAYAISDRTVQALGMQPGETLLL